MRSSRPFRVVFARQRGANPRERAYASAAMTGIDRSAAPEIVAKGAPDPLPALLFGRLAVDRCYALNQNARAQWERLGFRPFEPDDPERLDLYLLTSEIEATLKRAR